MLCQNCNKNEATMHMKRILGGRTAEVHLCSDCARSLGYGEAFNGFGLGFAGVFSDFLSKNESSMSSARCHLCGKSFEEIAGDGKMGCAECYASFYDKLIPYLSKVHGRATHMGKKPLTDKKVKNPQDLILNLKTELKKAVEEQNFELAAKLRDEINAVLSRGGDAQ